MEFGLFLGFIIYFSMHLENIFGEFLLKKAETA